MARMQLQMETTVQCTCVTQVYTTTAIVGYIYIETLYIIVYTLIYTYIYIYIDNSANVD